MELIFSFIYNCSSKVQKLKGGLLVQICSVFLTYQPFKLNLFDTNGSWERGCAVQRDASISPRYEMGALVGVLKLQFPYLNQSVGKTVMVADSEPRLLTVILIRMSFGAFLAYSAVTSQYLPSSNTPKDRYNDGSFHNYLFN